MLKVGLAGIGFMGRGHLNNYIRLAEAKYPIELVAICDVDEDKFKGDAIIGNIELGLSKYDFSQYKLYSNYEEMLEKEQLDCIDIALPTYLHKDAAIKALNKGINVLCEKPMALNSQECQEMVETAKNCGKKFMVAQCLRFWPEYEWLKNYVDTGKLGKVLGGYFYRGGNTPLWSYQNWMLDKDKSGGCLLDQHIHDVDMINWLFGKPEYVSTSASNVIEGSGYDIVSTQYIYSDGKVINSQGDWMLNGDYDFEMQFRVTFEKGNLVYKSGRLKVNPNDGKGFTPEMSKENGYYREIIYFMDAVINDKPILIATPESTTDTIRIAEAEVRSADLNGEKIIVE